MKNFSLRTFAGVEVLPWLNALAALRLSVFQEFPYLYDGSIEYERKYIQNYARSPKSLFVLAFDKEENVVGASTGLPLADADRAFQEPFIEKGILVEDVYYFGESVLARPFRGRGIGHSFFDEREAFARKNNFIITTFCAVIRAADDPRRPHNYRPLDEFWRSRGYEKQPDMVAQFHWTDIGDTAQSAKPMQFWLRYVS